MGTPINGEGDSHLRHRDALADGKAMQVLHDRWSPTIVCGNPRRCRS
jgi:hypothetical protein